MPLITRSRLLKRHIQTDIICRCSCYCYANRNSYPTILLCVGMRTDSERPWTPPELPLELASTWPLFRFAANKTSDSKLIYLNPLNHQWHANLRTCISTKFYRQRVHYIYRKIAFLNGRQRILLSQIAGCQKLSL